MSEISIVETADIRDIRFLPAEEKDLIFQTFAKDKVADPVALGELRRLIDLVELSQDFGQGNQSLLHSAIELAAKIDGTNAMIVPLIGLPKHDFSIIKRGQFGRKTGAAEEMRLTFTEPKLAYVDLPKQFLMAVSTEVSIAGIKVFGRNSEEFVRHVVAGTGRKNIQKLPPIFLLGKELTTEDHKPGDWLAGFCTELYKVLRFSTAWAAYSVDNSRYAIKLSWPKPQISQAISAVGQQLGRPASDKLLAAIELQQMNMLAAAFIKDPSGVIQKYLAAVDRKKANALNKIRSDAAMATRKLYEYIIIDKFGKDSLVRAISKANESGKNLLEVLGTSERKIVEAEKNALDKHLLALKNNKCTHVKLLKEINSAVVERDRQALVTQLAQYIGKYGTEEIINCTKCEMPLICPHKYALYKGERVTQFSVVAKSNVYCKVCGELLSLDTEEETARMEMDEAIAEMIWNQALILSRLLELPPAVSFSKFIQGMRTDIYKYVAELYSAAAKSKTSSAKEISTKQEIYTAVYILAWFVKFSLTGKISFKSVQLQKGKEAALLLHHCIKSMMSIYSGRISTIQGITAEVLKTNIVQAYKSLLLGSYDVSTTVGTRDELMQFIASDAMYGFLCQLEQMTLRDIPKDRPIDRIERLLGIKPDADTKKVPKNKQEAQVPGASIWKNAKNPPVRNAKHMAELWEHMLGLVHDNVRAAPLFINASSTRGRYATVTVVVSEEHKKAQAAMEKLAAKEEKWRFAYRNLMRKPVQMSPIVPPTEHHVVGQSRRRVCSDVPQSLALRYDENGTKHKWEILVIDGKDYKSADYAKTLPADYPSAVKCSVCGLTKEEAEEKQSDKKIKDALEMQYAIENFFRFYAFKCPVSEVHELPKCSKCGWYQNMSKAEAKDYFVKYRAVYNEQKKQEIPQPKPVPEPKPLPTAPPEWSFNYDIILELATKLGINHRQLAALGGYEREELKTVLSGSYIAPNPELKYSTRIFKLLGYLHSFVVEYNRLRNIGKIPNPPKSLTLFAEQYISRTQYKNLENLPALPPDFLQKVEGTRRQKKPATALEYILHTLCEELLRLLAVKGELSGIATAFVKDFMRRTLNAEELLTKPGYFNWALFYGTATTASAGATEDTPEIIEDGDDEDGKAMSNKSFDVEEKDDQDDPDDEQNLIRLEGVD